LDLNGALIAIYLLTGVRLIELDFFGQGGIG
jgi:hypothetical protein